MARTVIGTPEELRYPLMIGEVAPPLLPFVHRATGMPVDLVLAGWVGLCRSTWVA